MNEANIRHVTCQVRSPFGTNTSSSSTILRAHNQHVDYSGGYNCNHLNNNQHIGYSVAYN